jgi:hypothetical protein
MNVFIVIKTAPQFWDILSNIYDFNKKRKKNIIV